mmetsp:Transcript_10741/g.31666  ORF Transcript_10741/g.31666 Transcript_10741/m.31666 type:complete len:236 (+) Transcript_10741:762-1469(+)
MRYRGGSNRGVGGGVSSPGNSSGLGGAINFAKSNSFCSLRYARRSRTSLSLVMRSLICSGGFGISGAWKRCGHAVDVANAACSVVGACLYLRNSSHSSKSSLRSHFRASSNDSTTPSRDSRVCMPSYSSCAASVDDRTGFSCTKRGSRSCRFRGVSSSSSSTNLRLLARLSALSASAASCWSCCFRFTADTTSSSSGSTYTKDLSSKQCFWYKSSRLIRESKTRSWSLRVNRTLL